MDKVWILCARNLMSDKQWNVGFYKTEDKAFEELAFSRQEDEDNDEADNVYSVLGPYHVE